MSIPTKEQTKAAVGVLLAVAEAIRELKEVPSGHLYARLMDRMTLDTYNGLIAALKNTGLVTETAGHMLKWTGPAISEVSHVQR